ncbi:MAG: BspA family leucine-rich repeat surface protein [Eggerthellaceae bacterium]
MALPRQFFHCEQEKRYLAATNRNYSLNANNLFANCSSLENLDVAAWDTAKVNSLNSMFSGCSGLAITCHDCCHHGKQTLST